VTSYELEVRETDLGDIAFAALAGELDLTNAEELERRLEELSSDASALVLDLNRIQFLDSAALHVLFSLSRRLADEGRGLGLVLGPEAPAAKTISIVSLDEVSTIRPSLEDVLAELRASPRAD
jgi:anti-anti-sigma factor